MKQNAAQPDSSSSEETHRVHFWRSAFAPAGYVGFTEVPANSDRDAALSHAFAVFNRGSGAEVEFEGPSASVGDVFAVENRAGTSERTLEAYRIRGTGFQRVDFPPIEDAIQDRNGPAPETQREADSAFAQVERDDRQARAQRDLDQHDRMMASRAADSARDTLHNSTPFEEPGSYTVYEARDRAAHTPSIAPEIERQSTMADKGKSIFSDNERYLLDVQRRKDMAEIYPDSDEARWLRERERMAGVNPEGPEARQIAEEARLDKLYRDAPQGAGPQGQNNERKEAKDVTPEQKVNVDRALADTQLSDKIGGATDVGGKATPNDPTPTDKSREIGQDLQRQGVTMDQDK
jgi:hypothetical protein